MLVEVRISWSEYLKSERAPSLAYADLSDYDIGWIDNSSATSHRKHGERDTTRSTALIRIRRPSKLPTTCMALKLPPTLKLQHLKALAYQCGISSSGTKAVLTSRLLHEIRPAPGHACQPSLSNPVRILSIDMGIRNLAFCLLDLPAASKGLPAVTAWQRIAVSSAPTANSSTESPIATPKEVFDPPTLSLLAYNLLANTLLPLAPTHILIERQRFRSMGRAQILEWTVRVNMFESILYAILYTLRERSLWTGAVIPIAPGKVGPFWLDADADLARAIERETKTRNTKNAKLLNKGAKIDLVKSWLEAGEMIDIKTDDVKSTAEAYLEKWYRLPGRKRSKIPEEVKKPAKVVKGDAEEMGKLDDLADCLLQGMAWLQWEKNKGLALEKGIDAFNLDSLPTARSLR